MTSFSEMLSSSFGMEIIFGMSKPTGESPPSRRMPYISGRTMVRFVSSIRSHRVVPVMMGSGTEAAELSDSGATEPDPAAAGGAEGLPAASGVGALPAYTS